MAQDKTEDKVISFYTAQFDECFALWDNPLERTNSGVSLEYAAYHTLAHAAFLDRIDAKGPLQYIEALPNEQLVSLVEAACRFVRDFELPPEVVSILEKDWVDADDIVYFELVLSHRDELDLVIEAAKRFDEITDQDHLLRPLATAVSVAAGIDDQLLAQPELMSVCSRSLVDVRAVDWLRNGSYPDWFAIARDLDEGEHSPAGKHHPPPLTLLTNRNKEITKEATSLALAASANSDESGPAEAALQRKNFPIVGDPVVEVSFELRPAEKNQRELVVALVANPSATRRYDSMEVSFGSGDTRRSSFESRSAELLLQEHEVELIVSLVLKDERGNRRKVNLLGLSDDQ